MDHYFKELEDNDKEKAHVAQHSAEEIKDKIKLIKYRKKRYQSLLRDLKESENTQVSLTDPDSRAMVNNQRVEVCYNIQRP